MQPDDTGRAYDQIAHQWAVEGFLAGNGIAQHAAALVHASKGGVALDVGCGCNPRLPELLGANGFVVEGVDVSSAMIETARRLSPGVTHHLADIRDWALPRRYGFITAWDSLWHLPLADQLPVMRKLLRGLEPGGVMLFTMGGLDEPAEKTDSVMGPLMYYSTPGIGAVLRLFAEENCQCLWMTFDQPPEPHLVVAARSRLPGVT